MASALALMILSFTAAAQEFPVLDRQVEIRQAHLEWQIKKLEVGMQATLDYIQGISNVSGAGELSAIMNTFREQNDNRLVLTTHVGLNNASGRCSRPCPGSGWREGTSTWPTGEGSLT